ncbi:lectin [Streptomyces sp. SL13]|uniref:Lectin n=1 Tax=Streptantibioticus silvisoli TaxID=2705255 RepID=A0AA90KBL0_9ACTN|nr:lectin [Streptantibioticus silvisoli]MDI5973813.1 lectin [Streptantibioticus silvisoli]
MARLRRPYRTGLLTLLTAAAMAVTGAAGVPALAATHAKPALVTSPASLVNPFIGTSHAADDFPGADSPFGMVQWSPDTPSRPSGGGYEYNDSSITGFSLTHIAGPGCGAGGDVPVLPTVGSVNTGATDAFSHSNESASPGAYTVSLNNGVKTELTTTTRSGMARFTFPSTTQANLIFKLAGSQNGDSNTQFNVVSNTEVSGQVTSGKFCGAGNTYTVYFDMVFDQPFSSNGTAAVKSSPAAHRTGVSKNAAEKANKPVLHGSSPKAAKSAKSVKPATAANNGYLTFNTTSNQVVQAKVGVSYVSTANAVANRTAENPNWNFDSTRTAAQTSWNSLLGKVQIGGGTAAQQTTFYTALYHSLLHPNVISDTNGQYYGFDGKTHTVDSGHTAAYANYSGWDIYRSQAQLEALVDPTVASDTAQSMVDDYTQTGQFPKWSEDNGESYVMVGDPADEIIADYYAFGARNFDTATALTDLVKEANNTNNNRPGLNYLEQVGYLPSNGSYGCCNFYGPASTTLEYDSADFALSALAGSLGDTADQSALASRAQDWKNLYNSASGFIQPRDASGAWTSGFSATSGDNFVEGDSWQYTPMVPFNLHGLSSAMGGNAALDTFLNTDLSSLTGANGYTDLGNEPSLNIPWEYDYIGHPSQTQGVVRQVQDQIWTDSPSGLAGNDDLGEMSSWYVWSALGMYPETPGTADLALGSPMFTQSVVTLPSGNTLTVNGTNAADNAPYVQSASWNGSAWNNAYAPAAAVTSGGTLGFTLGTSANTSWASATSAAPPSYAGNPGYSDAGVSDDSNSSAANFDGGGFSYSAQALSAAGVTPGGKVSAAGVSFTWPNVASGKPDNYEANGQTVTASGTGAISFLGAANNGPSTGTATVTYTDGTTQNVQFTLSDWTLNGGGSSAAAGNTVAATAAYRNQASASSDSVKTYLFATAPVALASGKTVSSVRLPSDASAGGLHVFAVGFGGTPAAGPVVSGLASTLCLDDANSSTTSGNPVQIWTCNASAAQNWTPGADGTLRTLGGCLDAANSGTADGTKVQWYACNGSGAQVWTPGNNASFVNPESGKCLDDPNSSTTTGTQLQLYTCNASTAQRWTLT